jgi:hypothetical protein
MGSVPTLAHTSSFSRRFLLLRTKHWLTKQLINYLTPRSRVLLEKPTGPPLVKKFPAFYGTRRFIITFTKARYLSLSWTSWTQSMPPYPTSRRSISILSSHPRLGLSSGLLPSGLPTKILYTPLLSPHVLYVPPISFISILWPELYLVISTDH